MDNIRQLDNNAAKSELYLKAQRETVAMCIYSEESVSRVCEIISPDDFLDEKLNAIISAIIAVFRRDEPVNVLSVASQLQSLGYLKFVGGITSLYELYQLGEKVTLSNTPIVLANIVKEAHVKCVIQGLLKENSDVFLDDSGTTARDGVEQIVGELSEQMLSLNDDATLTTAKGFMAGYTDLLAERHKVAEENKETSGGLQGVPTLLPSLNKYTSGFTPGQLITIGAKTGVGKSVFAIMSTISALKAGKTVMFFSLEMSETEIFDRIIANMSQVKLNHLKNGGLTEEESERVRNVVIELKDAPLIIDTDTRSTVDSVRSKAIRQQQSEEGLDFIIVDYLQLMSASQRYNSRQELVADLSRNMKLMAKSLNIPVMILTQLNRQSGDDDDEHPKLDQIRESGAIAQDSDIVILLHREKSIDNKVPQTLILLEKNRSGESNKVIRCHTELAYSDFREVKKVELGEGDNENNENNENMVENDTVANFYDDNIPNEFDFPDDSDFFDAE